jgi:hypothetical protein
VALRKKVRLYGKCVAVIKMDIPVAEFKRKFIEDPENLSLQKKGVPKWLVNFIGGDRYASKSAISPKYIVKKRLAPKQIFSQMGSNFKGNKKLFVKGSAKVSLGLGLLASSALLGMKSFESWKKGKAK